MIGMTPGYNQLGAGITYPLTGENMRTDLIVSFQPWRLLAPSEDSEVIEHD